jgi:hypothetical protein
MRAGDSEFILRSPPPITASRSNAVGYWNILIALSSDRSRRHGADLRLFNNMNSMITGRYAIEEERHDGLPPVSWTPSLGVS